MPNFLTYLTLAAAATTTGVFAVPSDEYFSTLQKRSNGKINIIAGPKDGSYVGCTEAEAVNINALFHRLTDITGWAADPAVWKTKRSPEYKLFFPNVDTRDANGAKYFQGTVVKRLKTVNGLLSATGAPNYNSYNVVCNKAASDAKCKQFVYFDKSTKTLVFCANYLKKIKPTPKNAVAIAKDGTTTNLVPTMYDTTGKAINICKDRKTYPGNYGPLIDQDPVIVLFGMMLKLQDTSGNSYVGDCIRQLWPVSEWAALGTLNFENLGTKGFIGNLYNMGSIINFAVFTEYRHRCLAAGTAFEKLLTSKPNYNPVIPKENARNGCWAHQPLLPGATTTSSLCRAIIDTKGTPLKPTTIEKGKFSKALAAFYSQDKGAEGCPAIPGVKPVVSGATTGTVGNNKDPAGFGGATGTTGGSTLIGSDRSGFTTTGAVGVKTEEVPKKSGGKKTT